MPKACIDRRWRSMQRLSDRTLRSSFKTQELWASYIKIVGMRHGLGSSSVGRIRLYVNVTR